MSAGNFESLNNDDINTSNQVPNNRVAKRPGGKDLVKYTVSSACVGAFAVTFWANFLGLLVHSLSSSIVGNNAKRHNTTDYNSTKYDFVEVSEYSSISGAAIGVIFGLFSWWSMRMKSNKALPQVNVVASGSRTGRGSAPESEALVVRNLPPIGVASSTSSL